LRGSDFTSFPAKLHLTFASPILSFDKPSALEVAYRPPTYFKRLLKCTDTKEGVMKQLVISLMVLIFAGPLAVFAATMENTDSQEYEFQIQEAGRPYSSQYRMLEHSKVDLCFYGCQITLLNTGQTVWVNQGDSIVISNRGMSVYRGAKVGSGW
jgi:hypothetical protein